MIYLYFLVKKQGTVDLQRFPVLVPVVGLEPNQKTSKAVDFTLFFRERVTIRVTISQESVKGCIDSGGDFRLLIGHDVLIDSFDQAGGGLAEALHLVFIRNGEGKHD